MRVASRPCCEPAPALYSHHLIAMRDGRLVAEGTPAEITTERSYTSVRVALRGHHRSGRWHADNGRVVYALGPIEVVNSS